jgi:hypothetical protein
MANATKRASKLAKGAFEWAKARKSRAAVKIRSRSSRDDASAPRPSAGLSTAHQPGPLQPRR